MKMDALKRAKQIFGRVSNGIKKCIILLWIASFMMLLIGCGGIEGKQSNSENESSATGHVKSESGGSVQNEELAFDQTLIGDWVENDGWHLIIKDDGTVYYNDYDNDNKISTTLAGTIEGNAIIITRKYSKENIDHKRYKSGNYRTTSGYEYEEDIPEDYYEEFICTYVLTKISADSIQICPVGYGSPGVLIRRE